MSPATEVISPASALKTILLTAAIAFLAQSDGRAQSPTQTIRGTVVDAVTGSPLPFATVGVDGTEPPLGAVADKDGRFTIAEVPVGRYDIHASYLGYEPAIMKEVLVGTGKEVVLTIALRESVDAGETITVTARTSKDRSVNEAATASARMFSVEEAGRYAGGFDDPARLATSFAGVASNVGDNGIVIRGNAPKGVSWRMEGVEIPNPNHFADLSTFGGGGLTALSSQLLDNSDFFTGAFPAEYGNALSGVFDLHLRKGNDRNYEHAVQIGLTGIDVASEGPIGGEGKSSYLFNYRYSTLTLLEPLLPPDAVGIRYQDLSFKVNVPTGQSGVLSLWGIGGLDASGQKAETDSAKWEYFEDRKEEEIKQSVGTLGINYRLILNSSMYLHTGLTAAGNGLSWKSERLDDEMTLLPYQSIETGVWNYIFSSFLKSRIAAGHSNKTGVEVTALNYDLLLRTSEENGSGMRTIVDEEGRSYLIAAYSGSGIRLSDRFTFNPGIHAQYFTLNGRYSIEPRLGLQWRPTPGHSFGIAYGMHSRLERLPYYFVRSFDSLSGETLPNKDLDFSKAHHLVLSYDWNVSEDMRLKIEPYYQRLFSIPVKPGTPFSFINSDNDWFLNDVLANTGEGRNIGVDLTLEHFLKNGFYFLLTTSVFDSEYKGGDGIRRNTRYDKSYVFNLLAGKEWGVGEGDRNLLGLNVKLTYQGGDRRTPVDQDASRELGDVVYDEERAFDEQDDASLLLHFTATFRLNGSGHASIFGLNVLNATGLKEFVGDRYNIRENRVDSIRESIVVPNISYKLEF